MFNSRLLIAIAFITSALTANAQAPAAPPPGKADPAKFAAHKQKELERIAQRLQVMQTLQACVQAASDHASMKACHDTARAGMKHKE